MECKDDADWIKCCTIIKVNRIRQSGRPRKTWYGVKSGYEK